MKQKASRNAKKQVSYDDDAEKEGQAPTERSMYSVDDEGIKRQPIEETHKRLQESATDGVSTSINDVEIVEPLGGAGCSDHPKANNQGLPPHVALSQSAAQSESGPKTSVGSMVTPSPRAGVSLISKSQTMSYSSPDPWACSLCTFFNKRISRRCEMCNTPKKGS